jgi:hypothetical protein
MNTETANQQFIDSLPHDVLFRHILVDGERFTLDTFLEVNMLEKDVEHITIEDAQRIIALEVGEVTKVGDYLGGSEIKRIDENSREGIEI